MANTGPPLTSSTKPLVFGPSHKQQIAEGLKRPETGSTYDPTILNLSPRRILKLAGVKSSGRHERQAEEQAQRGYVIFRSKYNRPRFVRWNSAGEYFNHMRTSLLDRLPTTDVFRDYILDEKTGTLKLPIPDFKGYTLLNATNSLTKTIDPAPGTKAFRRRHHKQFGGDPRHILGRHILMHLWTQEVHTHEQMKHWQEAKGKMKDTQKKYHVVLQDNQDRDKLMQQLKQMMGCKEKRSKQKARSAKGGESSKSAAATDKTVKGRRDSSPEAKKPRTGSALVMSIHKSKKWLDRFTDSEPATQGLHSQSTLDEVPQVQAHNDASNPVSRLSPPKHDRNTDPGFVIDLRPSIEIDVAHVVDQITIDTKTTTQDPISKDEDEMDITDHPLFTSKDQNEMDMTDPSVFTSPETLDPHAVQASHPTIKLPERSSPGSPKPAALPPASSGGFVSTPASSPTNFYDPSLPKPKPDPTIRKNITKLLSEFRNRRAPKKTTPGQGLPGFEIDSEGFAVGSEYWVMRKREFDALKMRELNEIQGRAGCSREEGETGVGDERVTQMEIEMQGTKGD